ncbi:hypothetical protein [Arcobacter sp. CECT 9188]|uniref:hypothetical protein n=1 Tax=Arcobacter sp. CECT 9188 TaxID=2044505 RepID=UPI000DEB0E96|nr:hypothetical protein [Arcobacter sp. CECT 9188]RBQ25795.1 hypothetical protein CRU88_10795 [Arcobacter sp. CECT 9188]
MAIGNVIERGNNVFIYNEKNQQVSSIYINISDGDKLMGYTNSTVNIKRGKNIITYNEKGQQIGSQYVG